jgi:hypothetical protein
MIIEQPYLSTSFNVMILSIADLLEWYLTGVDLDFSISL